MIAAAADTQEHHAEEHHAEHPHGTEGSHRYSAKACKRRPKGAGSLTPASVRNLRSGLVNEAYRLTSEEVHLLWSTASPRMPRF